MYIFLYTGEISGSIPTPSEDVIDGLWDEKTRTCHFYVLRVVSNFNKRSPGQHGGKCLGQSLNLLTLLGGRFHFHLTDEESEAERTKSLAQGHTVGITVKLRDS